MASPLVNKYNATVAEAHAQADRIAEMRRQHEAGQRVYTQAEIDVAADRAFALCQRADQLMARIEAAKRHRPVERGGGMSSFSVNEPDRYTANGPNSFMSDLYRAQLKQEPAAQERIQQHQAFEVEKRAVTSTTLGGIIPPAYLVDLYAKASRNGRVFANEVNNAPLPDVGMSVIIPRLTQGLTAAAQTTQNSAVVTQDPTETDLTVNVNTIAGYSPVSRQGIERAAYSDQILFEDLTARVWSVLDSYCINGSGSNNQPLGLLNTSSIATSTASTATVAGIYPKIADLIQQISTNVGGVGYVADKIFMHPRRWGMFSAAVDSSGRPLIVPSGPGQNVIAGGEPSGYGYVGNMFGLRLYVDANIPTTLGATTNADAIIVTASPLVHLFERPNDPVTLAFEQQAATSLQVQLVAYSYVAFTAGRYPGASGAVTGAGLVPPTF